MTGTEHCRQAAVAAARHCVGTPFRPQGRVPGLGLDCVGVIVVAAAAAGIAVEVPPYALSGEHDARLVVALRQHGCRAVAEADDGDILVMAPSPRQRHLGIVTPAGLVHAHAGLGRVVEGPIDPAWAMLAAWRFPGV